jgi:pimeloyl-ACP methyl ester carboxylesterase
MPTFERGGCQLYYEVSGDGPPLLLVMGLATPAVGWTNQLPAFRERYRTIAFDNRGCGRSGSPHGTWNIADMAEDALALLDRLSIARAHVVGISMGGMIAQELALSHPGRVGALVLASTYAHAGDDVREVASRGRAIFGAADGNGRGGAAGGNAFAALRFLMETSFSPGFIERDGLRLFQLFTEGMPNGLDARGLEAQGNAALAFDSRARLGSLASPTLVLTGDEDRFIPPSRSEELARLIRGARLVKIPGGSHAVNFEQPERWNALVLAFLAEHDELLAERPRPAITQAG